MKKKNSFFFNFLNNIKLDNPWTIYFIFVIFNSVLAVNHPAPFSFPDEYGVIAIGNWMRGGPEWVFRPTMYFGYTFSPFVAIMLSMFDHIRHVYIGSLIIKSFQIALIPFFTYKILKEVLNVKQPIVRILIPVMVGLFPPIVGYSKYLSNDSTLHVVLFICFYIIGKCASMEIKDISYSNVNGLVDRAKALISGNMRLWLYSFLLSFFAVFSYATHGIGIAFIGAIFLTIIGAHIFTKRKLISYPVFLGSFTVFFLIDRVIRSAVMENVFAPNREGTMVNTFDHAFQRMTGYLFSQGGFTYLFRMIFSRLYYSFAVTFGFFQMALIALSVFAFGFIMSNYSKKVPNDKKPWDLTSERALFVLVLFSFVIIACGIGLSSLNNVRSVQITHGRFYFYGRYYDYMLLPMLIVGLYYMLCREINKELFKKYIFITIGSFLFLHIYIQTVIIYHASSGGVNAHWILGILPFLGNSIEDTRGQFPHNITVLLFAYLIVFGTSLLLMLVIKQKNYILFVLIAVFAFSTYFSLSATMTRSTNNSYNNFFARWYEPRKELEIFRDLHDEFPNLYVISNRLGPATISNTMLQSRGQLNFLNFRVTRAMRIDAWQPNRRTQNSMIISDEYHSPEYIGYDVLKIHESDILHIWIMGDEIIEYFNNNF
ncbi:MAG: hypothetical protein FWF81_14175 [Defluviitaleaceae bacterium]|nr:hypothetical protein [Defluviitaleaceae bacterium]